VGHAGLVGPALEDLLTGIVRGLGKSGIQRSKREDFFYTTLLNIGGPMVVDFVVKNLGGPSKRYLQGRRTAGVDFRLDTLGANTAQVRPSSWSLGTSCFTRTHGIALRILASRLLSNVSAGPARAWVTQISCYALKRVWHACGAVPSKGAWCGRE
jgi:hypothetical protein